MLSQVSTVGGLVKLDVEGGVDSNRKLWPYISNEVDAVGFFNEEIAIALAVGEPLVV